jgi:protease-4
MKKGKYILIILLIFMILISVTIFSFIWMEFGRPPAVKQDSFLEITLSGSIEEKAVPDPLLELFIKSSPLSMHDIWWNIRKARADSRIKGLILRLGTTTCDWGKMNEIREELLDFRRSGKKAYAYIEEGMDFDKEYYLATACDEIVIHPMGTLVVNGLGGDVPFLKKTLDKLGVEAEVEHIEEYKTAYNMFTEEGFTAAHKRMMDSIYGDLYNTYVDTLSRARGKSRDEVTGLIDHGFFRSENALSSGLVDAVLFKDELMDKLMDGDRRVRTISHAAYTKIKPSSLGLDRGRKVALIYGMGAIYSGEGAYQIMGSRTYARWFRQVRKDTSIAAVIFRVDSPGGSVVASDVIWREIALTRREKPVIVSMSDMAGSGGYWVALPANKIIAHPQTLTGSIGVIFGKFNMVNLYSKLGVTAETVKFGKNADIFSTFRRFTPEEKSMLKEETLWIYDRFLTRVAEGRSMDKAEVNNIGRGRVWTGNQAKELGLIDELGGLTRALELAKQEAGLPAGENVKLLVWPKKVSFWDSILGGRGFPIRLRAGSRWERILSIFQALSEGGQGQWALMPFFSAPR